MQDKLSVMAELVLAKEQLDRGDYVSWSAYHANRQAADITQYFNAFFTEAARNAPVICNQFLLSPTGTEGHYFFDCPYSARAVGVLTFGSLPPVEFSVTKG